MDKVLNLKLKIMIILEKLWN